MGKLYAIYFSATDTTRKCVASVCQGLDAKPDASINLIDNLDVTLPTLTGEDVVVVASPVYGGRLPKQVATALTRLKGENAIAIAMVVYGNRDYDDALLELTDILNDNGFRIAAAGAFVAQHSIFPTVGASRPDSQDEQALKYFGKECRTTITNGFSAECVPYIKGNHPYKEYGGVPLYPKTKEADCGNCGKCVAGCPMGAISEAMPHITDKTLCISCGRCIFVCATGARHYSGAAYASFGAIFKAAYSKRKIPKWTINH